MKRFFCATCGKMKRVQQWPTIISHVNSLDPTLRVGECNYHANGRFYQAIGRTVSREALRSNAPAAKTNKARSGKNQKKAS